MADSKQAPQETKSQETKTASERTNALGNEPKAVIGGREPLAHDTRDTNGQGGRLAAAKAKAAEDAKDTKVLNQLADGSVEETTLGALAETHGPVMSGPTVADLNPAFAPHASTLAGAQES